MQTIIRDLKGRIYETHYATVPGKQLRWESIEDHNNPRMELAVYEIIERTTIAYFHPTRLVPELMANFFSPTSKYKAERYQFKHKEELQFFILLNFFKDSVGVKFTHLANLKWTQPSNTTEWIFGNDAIVRSSVVNCVDDQYFALVHYGQFFMVIGQYSSVEEAKQRAEQYWWSPAAYFEFESIP